jgi:hypothetical protein
MTEYRSYLLDRIVAMRDAYHNETSPYIAENYKQQYMAFRQALDHLDFLLAVGVK